ncbi:MAG: hypothetical protein Q9217_002740 [Psora testacea]
MFSFLILSITALALYVSNVQAFWRLECEGSTGLARIDPLMSPGSIADHVHSIKGGSAFSPTSKADNLLNSNCTSCGVSQDLSAYWAPAMYFMHDDGTVELVPEKPPHKSYYQLNVGLTHDGKQQTVEAFPNGFQMIAGNNFNRNPTLPNPDPKPLGPWPEESQFQRSQRAIGFNCLHYAAGNNEPALTRHHMPDKAFLDSTCTDGIRLELQFPSCWNGQLDGGPVHKSHVAYPDGISVGNCPEGYDRRLITLFYETIFATDKFAGNSGRFVLANGDPTGFGYHGDFIAAWKDDTLEKAVHACNQQVRSGVMSECPVFEMTQDSAKCKLESPLPAAIAKEDVKGPMKGLVNGMQVAYGPAPAPKPVKPAAEGEAYTGHAPASQNIVPWAPLPATSAPLESHSTEQLIGQVHEKVAIKPQPSSTAPAAVSIGESKGAVKPQAAATTPAPAAASLQPGERVLTRTSIRQGQEVVEVVEEIFVTPVVVTTTIVEGQRGKGKEKRGEHMRRHMQHHHHHHHYRGGSES